MPLRDNVSPPPDQPGCQHDIRNSDVISYRSPLHETRMASMLEVSKPTELTRPCACLTLPLSKGGASCSLPLSSST